MLGDLGSHRADADLVRALGDPNQDVRMAAAHSLGRLQVPGAVAPLLNAMAAGGLPRGVGSAAVVAIGTPAVPHLLEHARGGSGEGRVTAAELLGQIGDPSSTPTLLVLLRDPAPAARAAAAHAFERLADDQAAEALAVALGDTEPAVRVAAATALGHVGGGAFDHLIAVARTDSFEPARAAAEAAARLDPDRVASAGSAPNAGPHLQEAADRIRMLR
jgi:HEAT repeat protein